MSSERYTDRPSPGEASFQVAISQERAQPLSRMRLAPGTIRYMYDRSSDSKANGEPGQDYLAFHYTSGRLAFAVCDGVGGSFLGNLAARFLGDHLVKWLWEHPSVVKTEQLQRELSRHLSELVGPASHLIENCPLPHGLQPIVREILEEKRAYGSEAMFVCGRIEWPAQRSQGQVALAWLGDAELQVCDRSGRWRRFLGVTAERWSSARGPRGNLQVLIAPADDIARIIGYSDGLRSLADDLRHLPDSMLDQALNRLARDPRNDDISLIDVALDEQQMPAERGAANRALSPVSSHTLHNEDMAQPEQVETVSSSHSSLASPRILSSDLDQAGSVSLRWTSVPGAAEYRVQVADTVEALNRIPIEYFIPEASFKTNPLGGRLLYARVQALGAERSSDWSEIVTLGGASTARAIAPASHYPSTHSHGKEWPGRTETSHSPDPTSTILPVPKFLSPPNNAIINSGFKLTWTAVHGAEVYVIQEAPDPMFDPDEVVGEVVDQPYFTVEQEEPGIYFYRVQAQTSSAQSAWSSPLRIRIHRIEADRAR
ncbi:MAG: protein phosphatase 2C domain-containing protein [Blastocatellia bacterium]